MKPYTPDQKLMALSWKQPYADLMLHGKIETRTWNTNYRGWVLICSSKQAYKYQSLLNICGGIYAYLDRIIKHFSDFDAIMENRLRSGQAIAIGKLVDSRPMTYDDQQKAFVHYHDDLYCHIYEDVRPIEPFDWKGSQGFREVTEAEKAKIVFL